MHVFHLSSQNTHQSKHYWHILTQDEPFSLRIHYKSWYKNSWTRRRDDTNRINFSTFSFTLFSSVYYVTFQVIVTKNLFFLKYFYCQIFEKHDRSTFFAFVGVEFDYYVIRVNSVRMHAVFSLYPCVLVSHEFAF